MIKVPNEIIYNTELKDFDVCVYMVVASLTSINGKQFHYLSYSDITRNLLGIIDPNPAKNMNVKNSVEKLNDMGYIPGERNSKAIYLNTPLPSMSYYSLINHDEIYKILHSTYKNKYSLLRYFAVVMGTVDHSVVIQGNKNIVTTLSISKFSELTGHTHSTILKMNKQLEDLKVLYISRNNKLHDTILGVARDVNIYGRYSDKALVDEYSKTLGYEYAKSEISPSSVTQRYNRFVKTAGKSFSSQDREKLISDVEKYNSVVKDELKKDMSVFYT